MRFNGVIFFILCSLAAIAAPLEGAFVSVGGKWTSERYAPTLSVPEHYDAAYQFFQEGKWKEALTNYQVITLHFPDSPFYADSLFYGAICYLELGDYDLANKEFDRYLSSQGSLKHFEKAFEYKYEIAEHFVDGSRRRPFGLSFMPRIASGKGEALKLFDEIIASLPNRDLAAEALYSKGKFLRKRREYQEAIETLQTLCRRFPKHTLSADGYLMIAEIYLDRNRLEAQNPDLIAHALVNLQRFQKSFPGDERIATAEERIHQMEEVSARSLYETARYYKRKGKPKAAAVYYQEATRRFPKTESARICRDALRDIPSNIARK